LLGDDFSFVYQGDAESKRGAYRVQFPGLAVRIPGHNRPYAVIDLSVTGLAYRDEEQSFTLGQKILLDLYVKDKAWVEGLSARLVWITDNGLTACVFEDLTTSQERLLDKLTLEIQKRLIAYAKTKTTGKQ
jgi:hypothetical protein